MPVTLAAHPLEGGRLLAEITNRIVSLNREHLGRGPVKAKAYALDNLIVCVLCGGVTPIEQMLLDGGDHERVLALRRDVKRQMEPRYREVVEALTGRRVRAFMSDAHIDPPVTIKAFVIDGPVPGFEAAEFA